MSEEHVLVAVIIETRLHHSLSLSLSPSCHNQVHQTPSVSQSGHCSLHPKVAAQSVLQGYKCLAGNVKLPFSHSILYNSHPDQHT